MAWADEGAAVWREDGAALVWTDGGCATIRGERVASAAVFMGHGHESNGAWEVPGKQTAVRAELFALRQALERVEGAVSIRCDCRIVVEGANTWRERWKDNAWFRRPLAGQLVPHADLWKEVDRLLLGRSHPCEILWTKGHPLPRHVGQGVSTELDAWGNYAADSMATALLREQGMEDE